MAGMGCQSALMLRGCYYVRMDELIKWVYGAIAVSSGCTFGMLSGFVIGRGVAGFFRDMLHLPGLLSAGAGWVSGVAVGLFVMFRVSRLIFRLAYKAN